ncbi:thioesterase family protein [Nocardioides zeae]|uniref:Thioesterase family protein n=1 Tax=Nocardioides imazamoxiresistens TaxID=3231893 RepID=A0ABU3PY29_9ACTN|nr:thioesterase family protein [Nocardioides zeae]MDT9594064.1 thioesterase family protein [Nocardioides zeae]
MNETLGLPELDRDLDLTPTGGAEGDDERRFAADLPGGWSVGGGINGGFLLALLGEAVRRTVPERPDPVTLAATYVGASTAGPAEVVTRVLRHGTLTSVAVELSQGGALRISALATFSDLTLLSDEVATTGEPPALPPVEECPVSSDAPPEFRRLAPLVERFEMRFDPACAGWVAGRPSGRGELRAWFRFPDREPDPLALLMVADAMPPVTFDLGRPGWAPTVQLTVHVRAVPADGWLRLRQHTRNVAGGFFEEDCEIWDSAGRLVAQARQLARVPRA